jgi:hypothetical protein
VNGPALKTLRAAIILQAAENIRNSFAETT